MEFLENVSLKLEKLQQRSGDMLTAQKLSSKKRGLKNELTRVHTVIGETCCSIHANGGDPEALYALMAEAARLSESIAELEKQINDLNHVLNCPKCGKKISNTLNFCPMCGAKLTAQSEEVEEN